MKTQTMKQHDQFDQFASRWIAGYHDTNRTVYCRKGCAGCCHLAVHATWPEAAAIAGELSAKQTLRLAAYIKQLQDALPELSDFKNYLKRHRQAFGPCPFLDRTGTCSIYPLRPLSCRALLSTRPAAWCTVDFSELDQWDKQAYESGLDRQVVSWPTHYVAATQDFGRKLESNLLQKMLEQYGWTLSGNFAVMVWLELNCHLSAHQIESTAQFQGLLAAQRLDSHLLLRFTCGSEFQYGDHAHGPD
jgi:Fe-S-cluster containining protein